MYRRLYYRSTDREARKRNQSLKKIQFGGEYLKKSDYKGEEMQSILNNSKSIHVITSI